LAQTGDSYQSEYTYGRDRREYLNRKIWRRQETVINQKTHMAETVDNNNITVKIWRLQMKVILQTRYGGDSRVLLNRKNMAQTGDSF
jgi:hypothetical protein